ncbi:hypothetical protein [Acutalibacter sp. 1XD8-33]|uniref:hypothetical protein n=1 Tax=Acutalibacter sp. 1XD8-33 TaxID=2320081 RepID=UPI00131483D0|nr:hypothetical protein [Acutalibacter sp. 1XD8-33]
MTTMFDPEYVAEVLNDILGRRGLELIMTPVHGHTSAKPPCDGPSADGEKHNQRKERAG